MPECKAARERNDMGRQDIFAYPVELSGEGHDRSLAAEANIISAVRPEIATARIQSDHASARVHHMSVAVERQNSIGTAVDEEQSVVPADPQPARIDDARIAAENANRLTIVGKRDNFSIASAVRTGRTCDEESHVSLGTYSRQDLLTLQAINGRDQRLRGVHPLGKSELVDLVDIRDDVRLGVEDEIAKRPPDEFGQIRLHQTVPFSNPLPDRSLVSHMLRKLQWDRRCHVETEMPGD